MVLIVRAYMFIDLNLIPSLEIRKSHVQREYGLGLAYGFMTSNMHRQ